ncbi:MAG: NYN domain-containing protein [Methanobacterium paludis]|nr:NYN domain-containing protein [Methanobacterium paludis]
MMLVTFLPKYGIDLISFAMDNQYDTAIIVSGDYDYFRAIEEVQRRGKRVEIAYFLNEGISEEFIQFADKFVSLNAIADKISKE